jgi:hypothetical protein
MWVSNMSDVMALLFGAIAVLTTGGFVVYLLKSHKASVEADKRQMELIEEQNQRIRKERQERRDRMLQTAVDNNPPPKKRMFEKREEVKPTYASSPTQSMQSYDNGATDMLVNMMIMDAVTRHHNEPTLSAPSRVEDTPSKSSSSWGFDDSDSRASAASSFSSSDSSSSWSSSSSDSSSSSVSSDW